uniref:Vacuolar ATPase assembly integral membrane protein VMA21 n=1 Tax=Strongyloides papillosus TaxID=174720 RepID=A0A0N5BAN2_STREA
MSKVFEPVKRQDSTDSEVEIVDPEECTDNGAKNEKKSDSDEKSKAESEHDTENDTDNDTCQEDEDVDEEGESENETEEDKWYGSDSRRKALNNLLYYSVLMFVLPLLTMYISYQFIFIDYFHYDTDTAAMYSGLVAACVVYIVIISFIWEAYNEEKEAENRKKTLKSE